MPGQYYFAWVDPGETTFLNAHKREDEAIFGYVIRHAEGDFASLDVTIKNPRVGLLAPGRKIWAWFAYEHPTEGTIPLFFGRLVAVPEDLQAEQVELSFIARPEDFAEQKAAVADTKKLRPYWDPIWFNPESRDDPDNVLESRSELWHIDRRSLVVTTSNIINGEDGNLNLGEADVFYDGTKLRYGQAPARRIRVQAEVSWPQKGSGELDITPSIIGAFNRRSSGNGPLIQSYTGEGLVNDWPKPGATLGGGWTVAASFAKPRAYLQPAPITFESGYVFTGQRVLASGLPYEYFVFDGGFQPHGGLLFPLWSIEPLLKLSYEATRQKTETLAFTLKADVQSVVTEPGDEEVLDLQMSSGELTEPVDSGGNLPIRDQRARSYFTTERGGQSIEYLIAVARARLLARARCVYIDVEMPLDDALALDVTLRKNVSLTDSHMPGGIAAGKIMEYSFQFDGDTGAAVCSITFGCTVGKGNTVAAVAGDPDYVDDDYCDPGYQFYNSEILIPIPGEVGYTTIEGLPPDDDGINFFSMNLTRSVKDVFIASGASDQASAMPFHGEPTPAQPLGDWHQYYLVNLVAAGYAVGFRPDYEPTKAIEALNQIPTQVQLTMHNLLGGPFNTDYPLVVTDLMVPKLIDLEAPSTP